jgi:hypothetical protein
MNTTISVGDRLEVVTEVPPTPVKALATRTDETPPAARDGTASQRSKRGRHADPRARRRSNAALLAFVLSMVVVLVGTGAAGMHRVDLALRPDTTPSQSAGAAAPDPAAGVCEQAAVAAQRAMRHWSTYVDDVQALYLATSTTQTADDLRQLSASYRAVVHDTVPVRDQLDACLVTDGG